MSSELKSHLKEKIEGWGKNYANDLRALSDEALGKSPGGSARTPYDFTYECIHLNERVACRLRGEDPGPWKFEGWVQAPEEFCNKDSAVAAFEKSVADVVAGLEATPVEKLHERIVLPKGETSPKDLADLVGTHLCYHDAQLNYCQALAGDGEVHWEFE